MAKRSKRFIKVQNASSDEFTSRLSTLSKIITFCLIFLISTVYWCIVSDDVRFERNAYVNSSRLPAYNPKRLRFWEPRNVKSTISNNTAGFNGQPFIVPESQETINRFFPLHYFNILASDRLPLHRYPGDARVSGCLSKKYPAMLPTASVIIVFHNEAWSTLLRTLHSIIDTSPKNLLREIILVDDMSTKVYLRRQLEDYVSNLECPVRVLRQGQRLGLIKARLLGVSQAKGDVIIFLDSHIECNEGWLEPLLARIVEDRTRVVAPIIDVIDVNDFQIRHANPDIWGGFDWKISFRWNVVPERELKRVNYDRTQPLRTPTIAGGVFAVDKQFFKLMGEYDRSMKIWGAENLEISFRVSHSLPFLHCSRILLFPFNFGTNQMWMCGGSLEIIPCSRIAHLFRVASPYVLMGQKDRVVQHNTARTVNVWLDEYTNFYYALYPDARNKVNPGNIDERLALRHKLNCRTFKWYLENIYPETLLPRNYRFLGQVENMKSGVCLDSLGVMNVFTASIHARVCHQETDIHPFMYQQTFMFTNSGQLVYDEFCLTYTELGLLLLQTCRVNNVQQKWLYTEHTRKLVHQNSGLCLYYNADEPSNNLNLASCDDYKDQQKWLFHNNFEWQLSS